MTFRPELEAALEDGVLVAVRRRCDDAPIDGFVLALGERVVLMQQFRDFEPDGWTLLRIDDVIGIEVGRDFWQRVFREEKLGPTPLPFPVDGALSFVTALKAAQGPGRLAIVECERESEEEEDDFVLARVLAVDDLRVTLRPIQVEGEWFDAETIVMKDVTRVQLETPYALMYARHAPPLPP
jgi:hypothetical protein